jgi:antitoxin component YwqK of YwqJK toxin-antitoxin module
MKTLFTLLSIGFVCYTTNSFSQTLEKIILADGTCEESCAIFYQCEDALCSYKVKRDNPDIPSDLFASDGRLNQKYVGQEANLTLSKAVSGSNDVWVLKIEFTQIKVESNNNTNTVKEGEEVITYWESSNDTKVIKEKGRKIEAKKTGEWITYFSNGKINKIENYTNDTLNGSLKVYYETEVLAQDLIYVNGRLTNRIYYFPNGQIKEKCSFAPYPTNTEKYGYNGDYVEYHENGQIKKKCKYEFDSPVGESLEYWDNGKLRYKRNYGVANIGMSKMEGEQISYYDDGKIQKKEFYKDGKRSGEFIEYYKTGKIDTKGTYKNGKEYGEWLSYSRDGWLSGKRYFNEKGDLTKYIQYNSDGSIKETKTYNR